MKLITSFFQRAVFFTGIALYSLLISHVLPVEDSSLLFSLNGIMVTLCLFSRFGLDRALLKEVALSTNLKYEKLVWGVIHSSKKLGVFIILIAFWYVYFTSLKIGLPALSFILIALCFNISIMMSSLYKGEGKYLKAAYFESGFYYTVCAIILVLLNFTVDKIEVEDIFLIQTFVILLIFTYISIQVLKDKKVNILSLFSNRTINYSNNTFGRIAVIGNLNKFVPLIILSMFSSLESVSVYKLSEQVAFSSGFVLLVIGGYYSSHFARMHKVGDTVKLFSLFKQSLLLSIVVGITCIVFLVIFEPFIFSVTNIYEEDYKTCFYILLLSSFVNIAAGPVFTYLTMTGQEIIVEKLMLFSLVVMAIFIPIAFIYQSIEIVALISLSAIIFQNVGAVFIIFREKHVKKDNI